MRNHSPGWGTLETQSLLSLVLYLPLALGSDWVGFLPLPLSLSYSLAMWAVWPWFVGGWGRSICWECAHRTEFVLCASVTVTRIACSCGLLVPEK
jgi:hypothetical protein